MRRICLFWEWAQEVNIYHFRTCFFEKGQLRLYYCVSHRVEVGTKVVNSVLRMLVLYIYFNGTCFSGVETTKPP